MINLNEEAVKSYKEVHKIEKKYEGPKDLFRYDEEFVVESSVFSEDTDETSEYMSGNFVDDSDNSDEEVDSEDEDWLQEIL